MSGIVGVWNLDGRPVERDLLEKQNQILAHRGGDWKGVWNEGSVGMACQLLRITPESTEETQPLIDHSGVVLVFDGRLDDRQVLFSDLKQSPGVSPDSPDPVLILAAYDAYGDRFVDRMNGEYALALFDPHRQILLLARDPIGMRPIYYWYSGRTVLFASEIKAILMHPEVEVRPDDDQLARQLMSRNREQTGSGTFFKGISNLQPAHTAIFSRDKHEISRYWDFDTANPIRLGSFGEYAEAFREHFDRAVSRRLRSIHPVAVSVSGGLDSSSIYCLAETLARQNPGQYPPILAVSYTSPSGLPSDEATFLDDIENEYGITIIRQPVIDAGPLAGSTEVVRHVEVPYLDELWPTTHKFLTTARDLGARVILTGHWADQLISDQAYLNDLFHRLAWVEIFRHLKALGRWYIDDEASFFRRKFMVDLIKYHLPASLINLIRSFWLKPSRHWYSGALRKRARLHALRSFKNTGRFITVHARSMYEQVRSNHHVLCMEWDNKIAAMHGLEMSFPFLDRDLVSFLIRIPGDMQTWKGIPKALLREAMNGVLPDAIRNRTWKADFTYLVNQAMEKDLMQLVEMLDTDAMSVRHGYLDHNRLVRELKRVREGLKGSECITAWSLSDLAGLELWMQTFFTDGGFGERSDF
jgi:asparagine synthase (glutamine-hydrolysing)